MQQNRRILIVDDQQDLREQLAKLLLRSGHSNETTSLVQGIRARLGMKETPEPFVKGATDVEYEVDTVGQGEDAFKMVQRSLDNKLPYAVMFTDMRMPPGWDGLETAKRVREIDKNIEIVIMTAFADHDQKKVADVIGTPHKLLYIKKPFQSEEINQLALALTSKWNFEETERVRKEWMESLIRCLGKVKTVTGEKLDDMFASILKSLLIFCASGRGFIAACNDSGEWNTVCLSGIAKDEVETFINAHSERLRESRTTLSVDNKYVLPLRREAGSFYVAGICDLDMQNDPEWYKMLSLLVMTSGEVLNAALINDCSVRKEQFSTLGRAMHKISQLESETYAQIRNAVATLETQAPGHAETARIRTLAGEAEKRLALLHDVLLLSDDQPGGAVPPSAAPVEPSIRAAVTEAAELCGHFKIELQLTGDTTAAAAIPADLLQRAFRNLALNAAEAGQSAGRDHTVLHVVLQKQKTALAITFSDDGPGIPESIRGELFEPFVSTHPNQLGIGLAACRLICERFGGTIVQENKTGGATFHLKLPLSA